MTDLLAVPFDLTRGDPERFTYMLDQYVDHPEWLTRPSTPEERRIGAAQLLTDPANRTWEVWRGAELVGILHLSRIVPGVNALLHFVFFDRNLVGKRRFLLTFLGHCFGELKFKRLSLEVPEHVSTLISFARRKLGFRYEGESRPLNHPGVRLLSSGRGTRLQDPHQWIARQGSRRESAYWHGKRGYLDIVCLRLLAEEYQAFMQGTGDADRTTGASTEGSPPATSTGDRPVEPVAGPAQPAAGSATVPEPSPAESPAVPREP